ncbi:MAG: hypothetical protein P8X57_01665 [Cyclobacteriaceae bacterium]
MNPERRLSQEPIPEIFRSYSTGTFFDRCIECDIRLLENEVPYFIEKAIKKYEGLRGYDVIFEYAICATCAEEIRKSLSKESQVKIMEYFSEHADLQRRMEIVNSNPENPEKWIESCLVKDLQQKDVQEFQIYAQCIYDRLLLPEMPYMISNAALDEMANLLSDKTLGEMDNFIGKHFGPPAEVTTGPRNIVLV